MRGRGRPFRAPARRRCPGSRRARDARATLTPRSASWRAIAPPMPRPAPVIRATLPSRLASMVTSILLVGWRGCCEVRRACCAGVCTHLLTRPPDCRSLPQSSAGSWGVQESCLRQHRLELGYRSETIRRANLSAIVRELHYGGPLSRSELGARTGLTRSAIRILTGELASAGLVREEKRARRWHPRPAVGDRAPPPQQRPPSWRSRSPSTRSPRRSSAWAATSCVRARGPATRSTTPSRHAATWSACRSHRRTARPARAHRRHRRGNCGDRAPG